MYVYRILLDKRPTAMFIVTAETDEPFKSRIKTGYTVTLWYREVRIMAQVVDQDEDDFILGQVIEVDGLRRDDDGRQCMIWPELQGLQVGTYLRFREEHVFSCTRN